jgi:hypothetical protein
LFAVQYALPGQAARYVLCAVYGGIAVVALARNRRHILPTLAAPFRRTPVPAPGNLPSPRPAGGMEAMNVTVSAHPVLLPVSGRSLVLVAGIPGAGKSTLMRTLRPDRTLRISDSDPLRSAVMRLLPRGMHYGLVRPVVHLLHRASVVCLALGPGGDGRGAPAGHAGPAPPRGDGAGQAEPPHGLPGMAGRPRGRGP